MKHSPLPWKVEEHEDACEYNWKIVDSKGNTILDCSYVFYEGGGSEPEDYDRDFILALVNNYDKIVNTIKSHCSCSCTKPSCECCEVYPLLKELE